MASETLQLRTSRNRANAVPQYSRSVTRHPPQYKILALWSLHCYSEHASLTNKNTKEKLASNKTFFFFKLRKDKYYWAIRKTWNKKKNKIITKRMSSSSILKNKSNKIRTVFLQIAYVNFLVFIYTHFAKHISRLNKIMLFETVHTWNAYFYFKTPWYDSQVLQDDKTRLLLSRTTLQSISTTSSLCPTMYLTLNPDKEYLSGHRLLFKGFNGTLRR